jgi:hypothetical protein
MCGPEGGWYIDFEEQEGMNPPSGFHDYNIMEYNINEVMKDIAKLPDCISEHMPSAN